jgi:hypothetical protein
MNSTGRFAAANPGPRMLAEAAVVAVIDCSQSSPRLDVKAAPLSLQS